ncbi:MAG TPA: lytic transglycosylase domain-containing protein [Acidobacteriota bacterium]|nr:lytic transglycosylase domain-containing protein [Acidobacteriota bacterium]HNT17925.1 lytic transglycosylase domain-containing protein [Acidobacteriota bacterium]HPA27483.1 lytic transglycosylase domain-containing protein [Acidobacteriota bacterium]HQO18891.1 lytic transglycosylase domain-containing protein [Acidobacteriota bacterium]HQQ46754.1 lytic transglycosylase domain-containing protein [Acidobacteriota bacterium]
MKKSLLFLFSAVLAVSPSFAMELVVFTSEKTIVAERLEIEGDIATLYLPGGNVFGCPRGLIMKSYPGYIPPPEEKEPEKAIPADVPFREIIAKECQKTGLDVKLVIAVIKVESNFNPRAVSPKGAKGLMQLMPSVEKDEGVTRVFDPKENIAAGVRYLKRLIDACEGDLGLALAAYNAGLKRVRDAEGLPNISETRSYVAKILAMYPTF